MLLEDVINGKIEMGIFFHIPEISEKLEVFLRKKFRYLLVVKKEARKDLKVIQSFIGSREIDDTQTRRFPTIERLRKDYPKTAIKISSNNLTAHKEMVLKGLGVSILPEFLVKTELEKGLLTDIYPKENFEFEMKFIKRKNSSLSLNAGQLLNLI